MFVSSSNNVKIYNLSSGKSLPEWLTDRKRRALQKNDVDVRRRIELIQDFEMPGISSCIKLSRDGNYVMATGIYKPRVRCYEVANLSMKFERCFDAEAIKFEILSDDYSKVVFLQSDRYVEFHAQYGRYYRTRIPKFGRDLKYHYQSCDLYIVGSGSDVYRLNLEQGRFLNPLVTEGSSLNVCDINPHHQLFVCGTKEGRVEAWDPRSRTRVGNLDCAFHAVTPDTQVEGLPEVSSIKFRDPLVMGVGMSTGQILLYDLRSSRPTVVKDHRYGDPIKAVDFHNDLVASMDSHVVRFWDRTSGQTYTSIEATASFNDMCLVPNTGLIFMANEEKKMKTYYIPSLGPAPRWCSFLDNLTEELEENQITNIYDDYKFITADELEDLSLTHLIGTNLLRAYMHGYFIDMRLYRKAKSIAQPFSLEEYKKKKIKEQIAQERANRVQIQKLPKINQELALKLMDEANTVSAAQLDGKKVKANKILSSNLLGDSRFKALFENPDYEIDKNADEFRLINPVVSHLDKQREKELRKQIKSFDPVEDEPEGRPLSDEDDFEDDEVQSRKRKYVDSSSSEEDEEVRAEVKRQHKLIRTERREQQRAERKTSRPNETGPKFFALKRDEVFKGFGNDPEKKKKLAKASLEERLQNADVESDSVRVMNGMGAREMTFALNQNERVQKAREEAQRHREERRQIIRSATGLRTKAKRGGGF